MATFRFDLVSPEKLLFSGEVEQVDVPGSEGYFGVLADHAPMVAMLRPGILTVKAGGSEQKIVVLGGFAEVSPSGLTVLADVATAVEDVDKAMIVAQIKEIEEKVKQMDQGDVLDQAIARLDHMKSLHWDITGTAMH
jgi:F-type H+-transporting ATPase subunit epsilon